jgi:hypothetical protein
VSVGTPTDQRRITNLAPGIYGSDAATWGQVQGLFRQASRGIAMTMAMGSQLTPSAPGKTTINLGVGFYSGESGFALNVAHRVNVSFPLFLDASLGAAPSGNWGGRVGIGIEF